MQKEFKVSGQSSQLLELSLQRWVEGQEPQARSPVTLYGGGGVACKLLNGIEIGINTT